MFKIAFKYIGFRYRQHRRKTSEKLVVETSYGPVRGVKRISCWDDAYYSFERIPFAKPPIGELRFADPQPPEPWTDIMDCTYQGNKPVQKEHIFGFIQGSEDCLFVNVFTKDVNPNKLRPVIVNIYGGGFLRGSTSKDVYSPDFFMSKDVVLVNIAYRLGLLGFLSLKEPSLNVPGNAGLKDQVLALKWVQQNISRFGGDPKNVTLLGQSAGAASVHYLGLSEKGKGLFHRMICMSGSAFCAFARAPYKDWPLRVAKELGFTGEETDEEVLKFLRNADCRRIVAVDNKILRRDELIDGYLGYTIPTVEPYITEQCMITADPLIMARNAWGNEIPMIAGGTSREGIYFVKTMPQGILDIWTDNPAIMLPYDAKKEPLSEKCMELGKYLMTKSFGDSKLTEDSYLDIISYRLFWHPIHRMVLSRQKYATAPTYLYEFEFDSPGHGLLKTVSGSNKAGVSHGDDLGYIFLNTVSLEPTPNSPEEKVTKLFVGMWSQYALNGDPNCDELKPVKWEPVDSDSKRHKCLIIGNDFKFDINPLADIMEFWDDLYEENTLV